MSSAKSNATKPWAGTRPAPKSKPVEIALAPVDNTLLANLCGPLDENLRQIEAGFDVAIARRGARFTLRGPNAAAGVTAL